jgi:hypothetical protein
MLMRNIKNTAAFMAASNVTTAKVKAGAKDIAKNKKPSKAELARKAEARAIASAAKVLENVTLDEAAERFAKGEMQVEGLRNVYVMAMNKRFASTLQDGGHHWTAIWASKNAKAAGSNLRPTWDAIDAERKRLEELLVGGTRKHSNPAQVWKRVRDRAFEVAFPGKKREPRAPEKTPAEQAMERLIAAYKVVAKESIQTERDERLVDAIGRLLVAFDVDLKPINQKIGG